MQLELTLFTLIPMYIRLPTREEIHQAFVKEEEAVVELILGLGRSLEELVKQLETQATVRKNYKPDSAKIAKTAVNRPRVMAMKNRNGR